MHGFLQQERNMTGQKARIRNQQGYLLLSVMLLIALMLIAMAVEAPRIAQQIQRGKEEELVHRGMEYAKAVKKFRRKMGAFPTSIEQLEDTNHIRFLRKRYKDPITGEDNWKLVHVGEAEIPLPKGNLGTLSTNNPGLKGGSGGQTGSSAFGSGSGFGSNGGGGGLSGGGGLGSGGGATPSGQTGLNPGGGGNLGSLKTSDIGNGQKLGGGGIIGVASVSKKSGIKEFHDSSEYDEWLFVYDPRLEQAAGQNASGKAGIIVAAPSAGGGAAVAGQGQGGPNGNTSSGTSPGPRSPK
jgi:type II secretory pathway pseudopilin PulG